MQCCLVFEVIDGYEVVTKAGERTCDPAETLNYVRERYPNASENEIKQLCDANKQYAPLQKNEKELPDNTCCQFNEKLAALTKHEKCLTDGTVIPDLRETEYWEKADNRWVKNKVSKLGETIPTSAVSVEDMNKEEYAAQRQEISDQQEIDRIETLAQEDRETELQGRLDALADEAARLEKRAQIQRKDFDPVAWYEEEAQKLHEKYGVSKE